MQVYGYQSNYDQIVLHSNPQERIKPRKRVVRYKPFTDVAESVIQGELHQFLMINVFLNIFLSGDSIYVCWQSTAAYLTKLCDSGLRYVSLKNVDAKETLFGINANYTKLVSEVS